MSYILNFMGTRWHFLGFLLFLSLIITNTCQARSPNRTEWEWREPPQGNLCGFYAVARAFSLIGAPIEIESLWDKKYISNSQGSTPAELESAIADLGGYSVASTGLTVFELRALQLPFIANTRSNGEVDNFDHWVCVVASENHVIVYDGPSIGKSMSYAEFLAIWNGVGIVVGRTNSIWFELCGYRIFGISTLLFLAYLFLQFSSRRHVSSTSILRNEIVPLLMITTSVACITSFMFGFVPFGEKHSQAIADALLSSHEPQLTELNLEDFYKSTLDSEVLLVDARMPLDFASKSIDEAVNIPPYAEISEIRRFLDHLGISKSKSIVVFCQSSSCSYSKVVGARLSRLGFQNVSATKDGINEFREFTR